MATYRASCEVPVGVSTARCVPGVMRRQRGVVSYTRATRSWRIARECRGFMSRPPFISARISAVKAGVGYPVVAETLPAKLAR